MDLILNAFMRLRGLHASFFIRHETYMYNPLTPNSIYMSWVGLVSSSTHVIIGLDWEFHNLKRSGWIVKTLQSHGAHL